MRLFRPPGLRDDIVVVHAKAPQAALNGLTMGQIEAVVGLIVKGLGARLDGFGQSRQAVAQTLGLDTRGHGHSSIALSWDIQLCIAAWQACAPCPGFRHD